MSNTLSKSRDSDDSKEQCSSCLCELDVHVLCHTCERSYCPECYKKQQEELDLEDPKWEMRGKRRAFVCELCYEELVTDFVVEEDNEERNSEDDYRAKETSSSDSSFEADTDDDGALDDTPRPISQEEKVYENSYKNYECEDNFPGPKKSETSYWDEDSSSEESSSDDPVEAKKEAKKEVKRKLEF